MTENNNTKNDKASFEELKIIIENHNKWVQSKGKEGERTDLSEANPFALTLVRTDPPKHI